MQRREVITFFGGAAVWPLAARAQQPERMRRIGALLGTSETDPETKGRITVFRQELQNLGWTEGRNLRIDYRWAAADVDAMRAYATELVSLGPDVILVQTNPGLAAVQQATPVIPLVFVSVADPVGSGFIASLARPGGNVTGFTQFAASARADCDFRF